MPYRDDISPTRRRASRLVAITAYRAARCSPLSVYYAAHCITCRMHRSAAPANEVGLYLPTRFSRVPVAKKCLSRMWASGPFGCILYSHLLLLTSGGFRGGFVGGASSSLNCLNDFLLGSKIGRVCYNYISEGRYTLTMSARVLYISTGI